MLDAERRRWLKTVGAGVVGLGGLAAAGFTLARAQRATFGIGHSSELSALLKARQWLNAEPLQDEDLTGKTVLINFWTYSCINSLRTLPYLNAWARKYGRQGLLLVGVHTPEFVFEHDVERVRRALASQGVVYPVVLDNDYAIWNAFANDAWPAFFFLDAAGNVRHRFFGEGEYDRNERWIQRLLSETTKNSSEQGVVTVVGEGAQAEPDWANLRSPETYIGYRQGSGFVSLNAGFDRDVTRRYAAVPSPRLNAWTLDGEWRIGPEFAELSASSGLIRCSFHARDLHLVLARAPGSSPIRYRVNLDGQPPQGDAGSDIDSNGLGVLDEDRMYQLIRQHGPIRNRRFEITFSEPGARAYVFTFG